MADSPNTFFGDPLHVRLLVARDCVIHRWWSDRGVRSPFWRYYVNSRDGSAIRLHADGSTYALPARRVHLVPAWIAFDLMPPPRAVGHLFAHFDIVGLPATVATEAFARPISLPLDPLLTATSDAMRSALAPLDATGRADAQFAAKSAIEAALAVLFAGLPESTADRVAALTRLDSPIAPALRRIEERLGEPLSVPGLASLCGFAKDHFARVFRRHVGQSPAQYVLERRIAVAAQRLALSDDPIEAIAADCGFPDRFYFTRMFARRMGLPPAAYRRAEPSVSTRAPA